MASLVLVISSGHVPVEICRIIAIWGNSLNSDIFLSLQRYNPGYSDNPHASIIAFLYSHVFGDNKLSLQLFIIFYHYNLNIQLFMKILQ